MKRIIMFIPFLWVGCTLNSKNDQILSSIEKLSSRIDVIQGKIASIESTMTQNARNKLPKVVQIKIDSLKAFLQTNNDIMEEYNELYKSQAYKDSSHKTKSFLWLLEKKYTYCILQYDYERLKYTKSMYDLDDLLMTANSFAEVPGYIFTNLGKLETLYHKFINESIILRKHLADDIRKNVK